MNKKLAGTIHLSNEPRPVDQSRRRLRKKVKIYAQQVSLTVQKLRIRHFRCTFSISVRMCKKYVPRLNTHCYTATKFPEFHLSFSQDYRASVATEIYGVPPDSRNLIAIYTFTFST